MIDVVIEQLTSLEQAAALLFRYSPEKQAGETYTVGRMSLLMERLGNPQNNLKVIHVAGTSGKTSTAYYVRALLEAYGQKTGLTSSPHIVSITERIQISGKPLPDELFLAYLNEFLHVITDWPDIEPTYFELLIAFAFWVFDKEQVDYAVVEVGLGGLLDATNVIHNPKICVITPIGLDHTEILGSTTRQIATQKAGIITDGSVVFSAKQDASAEGVIYDTCRRQKAVLHFVYPAIDQSSSAPLFQQENFGVAKAVTDFIVERDHLPSQSEARLAACITQAPPGRFEIYQVGNKTIILDGAHNSQKLEAFVRSLRPRYPEPIAWLIGFIAAPDSKIAACVEQIINPHDTYTVTEFSVGQNIKRRRSVPASEVLDLLQTGGVENGYIEHDAHVALQKVLEMKQRTVVVSGSLYLVATIRPRVIELAT